MTPMINPYRPKSFRDPVSGEILEFCAYPHDANWCPNWVYDEDEKSRVLLTADGGRAYLKKGDVVMAVPDGGYVAMTLLEFNNFINGELN